MATSWFEFADGAHWLVACEVVLSAQRADWGSSRSYSALRRSMPLSAHPPCKRHPAVGRYAGLVCLVSTRTPWNSPARRASVPLSSSPLSSLRRRVFDVTSSNIGRFRKSFYCLTLQRFAGVLARQQTIVDIRFILKTDILQKSKFMAVV